MCDVQGVKGSEVNHDIINSGLPRTSLHIQVLSKDKEATLLHGPAQREGSLPDSAVWCSEHQPMTQMNHKYDCL